ncbi:MAG: YheU family protein [Tepidisphaeraceae bacterium]
MVDKSVLNIPHQALTPEALAALIEDFVTRDGAVHGHADVSIDSRRESVLAQLRAGTVLIVFDEDDESVSIVTTPTGGAKAG